MDPRAGDAVRGVRLLGCGARMAVGRGRLYGLALIPPLITSVVFVTVFVIVVWQAPFLTLGILRPLVGRARADAVWGIASTAIVMATGLFLVLLFASVTLALGSPLYERISETVDAQVGLRRRAPQQPVRTLLARNIRRVVSMGLISLPFVLALLPVGFFPTFGMIITALAATVFGGWMIAAQMIGSPLDRRGFKTFAARHRMLRRNPWLALGFGIPTFLLTSVPGLSVIVFPVATAGGTLLARKLEAATAASS